MTPKRNATACKMKLETYSLAVVAISKQCLVAAATSTAEGAGSSEIYSLIGPLLLVVGALVAAGLLLKRWRGSLGGSAGPLQLVHVIALGPRERLALVKVGSRYIVVGVTPTAISRIAELSDIQAATPGSAAQSSSPALDGDAGRIQP